MTDRSKLLALAEAVEKLTGPDREVDAEIAHALGWRKHPNPTAAGGLIDAWINPDGRYQRWSVPQYTASLDAAMTLVPDDMAFLLDWGRYSSESKGVLFWEAYVQSKDNAGNRGDAEAATPALALTAAALYARGHAQAEALS